jgi:hypothetical protein
VATVPQTGWTLEILSDGVNNYEKFTGQAHSVPL